MAYTIKERGKLPKQTDAQHAADYLQKIESLSQSPDLTLTDLDPGNPVDQKLIELAAMRGKTKEEWESIDNGLTELADEALTRTESLNIISKKESFDEIRILLFYTGEVDN